MNVFVVNIKVTVLLPLLDGGASGEGLVSGSGSYVVLGGLSAGRSVFRSPGESC